MESFILGSGLRVVASPCPTETIYLGLAIDAGTRHEYPAESGMAHFVEHLTFKGTSSLTSRQIISRMESVGGELNAFTGKEETVYYCSCQRQYFRRATSLLFDIVFHSTYPQTEMNKEVEVVIDEIESYRDSPSELIYDEFESLVFQGHPLGRSILGEPDMLRSYKTEDVCRFVRRLYMPSRTVLFVYGNIDVTRHINFLERLLSQIEDCRSDGVSGCQEMLSPTGQAQTEVTASWKMTETPVSHHQAHVMMGGRAFGGTDARHLALFLANNIMGGPGLSSRLNLALREKRGLVYTVESNLTTYTDMGLWSVYFGCDHSDVARCKHIVENELHRFCSAPLSDKALRAAQRQLSGQIALSYDNFENVAIGMGKRMLHYGTMRTKDEFVERILSLSAKEVWEAACEVFSPQRLTTLEYK